MSATILAIETAMGACSAAIWHEGAIVAYEEDTTPSSQAGLLVPMIEQVLAKSNLTYQQLNTIAATIGPGSFTGIRIGLATARGLSFANKLDGKGYTTLRVMAQMAEAKDQEILVALRAGKGQHYLQRFDAALNPLGEATIGRAEETPINGVVVGNAQDVDESIEYQFIAHPRADIVATLAASDAAYEALSPLYIRPPDAIPQKALAQK